MTGNAKPIRLRAHHLLCMQGFQGYGYSMDFVNNMAGILARIDSNPDIELQIISDCDDICLLCPHNNGEICKKRPDSAETFRAMDERVLRILGMNSDEHAKVDELIERINSTLVDPSDIAAICGSCEWRSECLWYVLKSAEAE